MLILFIGLSLLIISFSSFTLGFQIITLNRVLTNTPLSIVETSIIQDPYIEEENVLFSKVQFEKRLNYYYEFELKNFKDRYNLDFYYFNQEDRSICMDDECSAVMVKFQANLFHDYHYERDLVFRVVYHFYES